jgi:peptidoglycan hydrolase-like protein with peptidoglycan-binding domain
MRIRPRVTALLACSLALGLGLAAQPVLASEPLPDRPGAGWKSVTYHGYRVDVPSSWRVVDLAKDPTACVRFDIPSVYLGNPGESSCPNGLKGRTAGLIIEPLNNKAAEHLTPAVRATARGSAKAPAAAHTLADQIQVAVEDAGVLVTAGHTPASEPFVRRILTDAKLVPGGKATKLSSVKAAKPAPTKTTKAIGPMASTHPGTYNGRGFDACAAPSQSAMNAWGSSPYRALGIYISGPQRACAQPNLTASWVSTQTANGWHFFPLDVGRQAPCTSYANRMSSDPATARSQGVSAASASVQAAAALGIGTGSVLYNDIEAYTRGGSCTTAVLNYIDGWTDRLHELGYLSGFYSSAASGVADMVANYNNSAYTRVDHIFFAWWNNVANTDGGSYIPSSYWANHQRIKQYRGDHNETYGGVTINIDNDYLDVTSGPPAPPSCQNSTLDFTAYSTIRNGSTGSLVWAAQCLLEAQGYDVGTPNGTFGASTETAVRSYQTAKSLTVDGAVGARTWTALLSAGTQPTLRNGSTGNDVRRLQRSLTAALGRTVGIDGQFGPLTEQAVRDYQTSRSLGVDGIVGAQTWGALQAGR